MQHYCNADKRQRAEQQSSQESVWQGGEGDTSVETADTTTAPTQNTSERERERKEQHGGIEATTSNMSSRLWQVHLAASMQAGWWAEGTNMLLRKHNYSYKFPCHLEGKEQKTQRKKQRAFFLTGLWVSLFFKIDLLPTTRELLASSAWHTFFYFKDEERWREREREGDNMKPSGTMNL